MWTRSFIETSSPRAIFNLGLGINLGTGVWVSFIGGVIMYKHLPRPEFRSIQQKLFPAYFKLTSLISIILLSIYEHSNLTNLKPKKIRSLLFLKTTSTLLNLLLIGPYTTKIMLKKNQIESLLISKNQNEQSSSDKDINDNDDHRLQLKIQFDKLNYQFKIFHSISSSLNLFGFILPSIFINLYISHHGF